MKTTHKHPKYIEWLSADEMHDVTQKWLLEMEFIKDEQLFFDDLIKHYTLQLIDSKYFEDSKKLVNELSKLQKRTAILIKAVKNHKNDLKILLDGINQPDEEAAYKKEHRELVSVINKFTKQNNALKLKLFNLVKGIIKKEKQKLLLK